MGLNETVVDLYRAGENAPHIANMFGVTKEAVYAYLRRRKIARRKSSESIRKYCFDQRYFSKIRSMGRAYWFGFILADGYMSDRGKYGQSMVLQLSEVDSQHLVKLKNDVKHSGNLQCINRKPNDATRLTLRSKLIYKDLTNLGLNSRKSFSAQVPDIDESLLSHFYRGLIDGDGCWTWHRHRNCWNLKLCGTYSVCNSFLSWIRSNNINTRANVHKHRSIFEVKFAGNRLVGRIAKILYDGANEKIWLDRKHNKIRKLL